MDKFISFQNKFNDFGKYYEERFLEKLNFSFIKNKTVEKLMLPKFLVLEKGAFAYVPFDIKFDSAPEFYEIEILFMKDDEKISASKNTVISNFDFDVKLPIRVPDLKGDVSLLLKLTIKNNVFEKSVPAKIIEFYENIPITYQYETQINLLMQQKRNDELQRRLDELNELILNTRHRTLYGACAWIFRKVFKSHGV